jgi:hypothetical protein
MTPYFYRNDPTFCETCCYSLAILLGTLICTPKMPVMTPVDFSCPTTLPLYDIHTGNPIIISKMTTPKLQMSILHYHIFLSIFNYCLILSLYMLPMFIYLNSIKSRISGGKYSGVVISI